MGKKHLNRSIIPPTAASVGQEFKYITKNPAIMNGWALDGNSANVFVSIRFLQYDHECFSDWAKNEMKMFWAFLTKLHDYTWQQIYDTSRKTDKTGFAYTKIPRDKYPDSNFKKSLDDQIELFELRVDNEKRVHGFRMKSIFYLCWLDRGHKICT